ncbi:DsrE family protein [Thermodesulfobacteriota bacterium B35]
MKLGIIISSNEQETVWNAFRFGVFSLKQGDVVKVFLISKGVESENLDTDRFKITEQMAALTAAGGTIYACGTCLKLRQLPGSETCPLSTMKDMHDIVQESDRILTF